MHQERGELEEAIHSYEKVLRILPDADTYNNLGAIYLEMGKPSTAMKAYRQALDVAPDHPEANFNLGLLLYEQGQIGEARKYFERAVIQRPDLREKIEALENLRRQRTQIQPGANPGPWPK